MASTSKRENEITRGLICERVRKGPRVTGNDIDGNPLPAALGTLFSRIVALAHGVDLENAQIHELLKFLLKKDDQGTTPSEADGHKVTSSSSSEDICKVSPEEETLLSSEDLWLTIVKVMMDVAADFHDAQLKQMTFFNILLHDIKGEMKLPPQSPWDTESFKSMERQMQDMCAHYPNKDIHNLISVQYGMLGRLAHNLGMAAGVLKLIEMLMKEEKEADEK